MRVIVELTVMSFQINGPVIGTEYRRQTVSELNTVEVRKLLGEDF